MATTPTDEQDDAVGLYLAGLSLAIEAGAGTGKTTTLRLLAESTPRRRGTYLAFNRATVDDARTSMPGIVSPYTAHGLAFEAVGKRYAPRLEAPRMRSHDVALLLELEPLVIHYGSQRKVLQPGFLAGHVMRAIRAYCQSADDEPGPHHVPYIDGIDLPDAQGHRTYANNDAVRSALRPALARAWADLSRRDGGLRFDHDCYLKLWALSEPTIGGEYLMVDEAQDTAPVLMAVCAAQAERGTQVIYVGDTNQQIYEWRGAVNAMATVPAEARTWLTKSWRFGPAIADVANAILEALPTELRLVGNDAIASRLTDLPAPDAVLCRTNARSVAVVLDALEHHHRPHLVGGGSEVVRFTKGALELQAGGTTWHPELACFDTWGEVQSYVKDDPQGGELRLLVDLIDKYGGAVILGALEGQPPADEADMVVSTAHKAKGREWARVRLEDDFPEEPDPEDPASTRLAYVAATRARLELDPYSCGIVAELARV